MNDLQKVASAISGYEPDGTFSSARDDFYYEQNRTYHKLTHIITYANNTLDIYLNMLESLDVMEWLDLCLTLSQNERWHAFDKLGKEIGHEL